MGAGDRDLIKRKVAATASVRGGILARRKEAATAPPPPSPSQEGFGILKKRKEAMAAQDLWELEDVPGGLDTWMDRWLEMKAKMDDEEEEVGKRKKKRKRVVKQRCSKALIDHIAANPFRDADEDLTPVELAKRSRRRRQLHAMTKFVGVKMRAYEQALVDQYNALGYAEDEREVTDSDSDSDSEEEDVTSEN